MRTDTIDLTSILAHLSRKISSRTKSVPQIVLNQRQSLYFDVGLVDTLKLPTSVSVNDFQTEKTYLLLNVLAVQYRYDMAEL